MKKFASLVLVILMMLAMFAVPAFAETVTTSDPGNGMTNVPFDNGYYGFCIDRKKHGASTGIKFVVADMSEVTYNPKYDGDHTNNISQELKLLFVLNFEDIFVSDGNGGYTMTADVADNAVGNAVYSYSEGAWIGSNQPAYPLIQKVQNYTGPEIPDEGHTITLSNGDVITFYFMALVPENDSGIQTFFAYKFTVTATGSTDPVDPPVNPEPEEKIVTVTFNSNGGSGTMDPQVFKDGEEDDLTPNAFTKDDHTFIGWNTKADGTGTPISDGEKYQPESNITLYAQWQKNPEVTFVANGGDGSMSNQEFGVGETKNLNSNVFERTGYTFTGWTTNPDGTGDRYTNEQLITVNSNITLYAQWEKNPVVTFDTNGGIGSMDKQEFKKGVSEELNENKFTRENYEFTSWNTKPDGSGTSYGNNDSIIVSEDITLYAQWKEVTPPAPEKHFVTFHPNCDDINNSMADQEFEHNVPEALNPNEFKRDGYEFTGWNTEPDGSGTSYIDKASITVDSNITLYAQWKEKEVIPPAPTEYEIIFNGNGGSGFMNNQTVENGVPEPLNPNEFKRDGYEFTGWNTIADGSGTAFDNGDYVTVYGGDVHLYAQWKKKEVTPPVNPDGDDPFNPGGNDPEFPEIGDDDVPGSSEFPETGDAFAPMLWLAMFALSIFGFIQMRRKAASR